jgi:nitrite reductase/ring-hydroxylating ferredoxin subunit
MFLQVSRVSDIAPGGMKAARIQGRGVVIGNYEGKFYCVELLCSHLNALLDKGTLEGYILTCPLHFAQFDITTGEALSGPIAEGSLPADLKTYPVQVEGDAIKVDVSST